MEQAFGVGCLLGACDRANGAIMAPLFGGAAATTAAQAAGPPAVGAPAVTARGPAASTGGRSPAAAVAPSAAAGWQVADSPDIGSQDNSLGAVSAGSPHDIWAVGNYLPDANPTIVQTLAVHYDGHAWTDVPTPDVGTGLNTLFGVSAEPSGHAWAVGEALGPDFRPRTLAMHFDGHHWTVVPTPSPGHDGAFFYGVEARGDSDVWAVGVRNDGDTVSALAEHFDGAHWTVSTVPQPGTSGNLLYAVTADASGVWATGQRLGAHSPDGELVEFFDGSHWSVRAAPHPAGETAVPFALGSGPDGLQLAGSVEPDARTADSWAQTLAGGHVTDQPTQNVGGTDNFFYGLSAPWAVGAFINPLSGGDETLIERDTGGTWATVPSPSPGDANDGSSILGGVVTFGPHNAWAVGTFDGPDARQTLILHYTG
jgi:hypothetical protein